ncbi:DUF2207 domain-containing protein [Curtobacterium sp. MCBD17_003]|uniref:DUF2207 domain-containing protein n=1 Tax=Curtobacterium sp. MCBD17_003 TaxID=2175667 RepID=UPI0011B4834A|nr:DUF2207 domain-containing protein [Curtobacterium sp. MCBD17_003]WIE56290.1 hypothetical protein DEI88_009845 [Curtobacterium sp. MCBD17_003]
MRTASSTTTCAAISNPSTPGQLAPAGLASTVVGRSPGRRLDPEALMRWLLTTAIIVGIVLLVVGLLGAALRILLWIGIVVLVIAVIGWLVRLVTGRRA